MRSRCPSSRRAEAVVALALVLAGCGGAEFAAPDAAGRAPDRIVNGPQGRAGQFVVECGFSHVLADDPIVHPGDPGGSHLHQFFGSTIASAGARLETMRAGDTTCDQRADTASYWTPMLLDRELEPIEPLGAVAYYRAGPGVDPTFVETYPSGLMLVAGDHAATEPQPLSVVAWSCGVGAARSATPPDCTGAPSLRMTVTFQDCWDGEHVRSPVVPEPGSHVAYSTAGECPATHPVHLPQLQLAVDYPVVAPDGLALSSGDIHSGHADFWNAWDPDKLEREVEHCLHLDLPCGVSG